MRALRMHAVGGPEVLRLEEVDRPRPGPADAIVEVQAASLNHLDIWVRAGQPRPPLPHTLGSDAAGVVVELGPEAAAAGEAGRGVRVGDEVLLDPGLSCGACEMCRAGEASQCATFTILGEGAPGTLAGSVRVPARNCHRKPAGFSWSEAAAFGLTFLTAWRMLMTRARLRAGEAVLINGIGGGVSTAALAIAKAAGARSIVVTSSSDAKIERARTLGATGGVNYKSCPPKDLWKQVREANGGAPVDVVVDSVGAEAWGASLRALRKGGRFVTCGATTGGTPPADLHRIFWSQLSILGSTMGTPEEMRAVLSLAEAGLVRPVIDLEVPLERYAEAFARLETGGQLGKVVVRLAPT